MPTAVASNGDVAGLVMQPGACQPASAQNVNVTTTGRTGFLYRATTGTTTISSSLTADFSVCPGQVSNILSLYLNASDQYVVTFNYDFTPNQGHVGMLTGSLLPGASVGQSILNCDYDYDTYAGGINDLGQIAGSAVYTAGTFGNSYADFSFPFGASPTIQQIMQFPGNGFASGGLINNASQILVFSPGCDSNPSTNGSAALWNTSFTQSAGMGFKGILSCLYYGNSGRITLSDTGYVAGQSQFFYKIVNGSPEFIYRIFRYHNGTTLSFAGRGIKDFPNAEITLVGVDDAGDVAFNITGKRADGVTVNASFVETCFGAGC